MSAQQGTLLDVLKKKMRQTKEEAEKYQEEAEEYRRKLQIEIRRREEVSRVFVLIPTTNECCVSFCKQHLGVVCIVTLLLII